MSIRTEPCDTVEHPGWLALREQLWAHRPRAEHLAEMAQFVANPQRFAQFLAVDEVGHAVGLAELALRTDYVNGTNSSPVAFLEGVYVIGEARRRGVARSLLARAEAWAREAGCTEFASDAALRDVRSHAMHAALGFEETERVVYFRKPL